MSTAMGMLHAVSCGMIGAGLALIPERPRQPLLRGLIAGSVALALSVAVRAVAS